MPRGRAAGYPAAVIARDTRHRFIARLLVMRTCMAAIAGWADAIDIFCAGNRGHKQHREQDRAS